MSNLHNDQAYEDLFEAAIHDRAEEELMSGDIARFWEAFGPDGVYELFVSGNTNGRAQAKKFITELRSAIADQDAKAVGWKVLELMWGVYESDALAALEAEEWRPFGWERCDE